MGTFDTFKIEGKCYQCGMTLFDWQTKDLERMMRVFCRGDKMSFFGMEVSDDGTVNVYTECSLSNAFLIDPATGDIIYPFTDGVEEERAKYCGAWNEAIVIIKKGIVDSIVVTHSRKRCR